eukprot:351009-Chlamydomonas_euryale.AAC.6
MLLQGTEDCESWGLSWAGAGMCDATLRLWLMFFLGEQLLKTSRPHTRVRFFRRRRSPVTTHLPVLKASARRHWPPAEAVRIAATSACPEQLSTAAGAASKTTHRQSRTIHGSFPHSHGTSAGAAAAAAARCWRALPQLAA